MPRNSTIYCDACEKIFRVSWRELEKRPCAVSCPRCGREAVPILLPRAKIRFEHVDSDPDPEVHIHQCIQRLSENPPMQAIVLGGFLVTLGSLMVAPLLLCPVVLVLSLLALLLYIVMGMRRFLRGKPILGAMRIIRQNLAPLIWRTPMLGTVRG